MHAMTRTQFAAAVFFALIVALAGVSLGRSWNEGWQFYETALNAQQDALQSLQKRTTIAVNTTSTSGLLGLVGLVLIVDEGKPQAFDRTNSIPTFRPAAELIAIDPVNRILYEGKVTNKLNAGGAYTAFTTDLSQEQVAEITVKDEVFFGYRDVRRIPYLELRKLTQEPGKAYYFVESATLTSTSYRTYKKVGGKAMLDGTAFKANGDVFASNEGQAYLAVVSLDLFRLSNLDVGEGAADAPDPNVAALLRKLAGGTLNTQEASALSQALKQASASDNRALLGATIDLTWDQTQD
jgi:hypothetical protein